MWIHTVMRSLDDLLQSDVLFYGLIVILCVLAWTGCDWIADWRDQRLARAEAARARHRQPLSSVARQVRGEDRRDVRTRLRADVQERRDQLRDNLAYRPMWLTDPPADRAQSAAHGIGAQGIVERHARMPTRL